MWTSTHVRLTTNNKHTNLSIGQIL